MRDKERDRKKNAPYTKNWIRFMHPDYKVWFIVYLFIFNNLFTDYIYVVYVFPSCEQTIHTFYYPGHVLTKVTEIGWYCIDVN